MKDLLQLPDNLPAPADDGACNHLLNLPVPSVSLISTSENTIDVAAVKGTVVIFIYPMNGHPDSPPIPGWNEIPGARGCTPQSCSFRDYFSQLKKFGVTTFGLSAQPLAEQQEAHSRLKLPFELLNDTKLEFTNSLRLPTFEYNSTTFIKRITLVLKDGVIRKVFYPVFPPDKNVIEVINWLNENREKPCAS